MKSMSFDFKSRRSMVIARRGMVAASNPLGTQAGLNILRQGGNAADAAIAAAAVMNVTAPASTGIGGDCFALYYDAKTKQVTALNGSGRAPQALSIDYLAKQGITGELPRTSPHTVTVPGAAMGWCDLIERFGRMSMKEVLADAIHYADDGYGVSPVFGQVWASPSVVGYLRKGSNTEQYLPNGNPPKVGQVVQFKDLARTFRAVAEGGAEAFYTGEIAQAIVDTLQALGGVMTLDDLKAHHSTWEAPISSEYRGVQVLEHPPNGQGLTALIGMNIAKAYDLGAMAWDDPERLHIMIEAMRLAFADGRQYIADPATTAIPIEGLLSEAYADERRKLIDPNKALHPKFGIPPKGSNTIYLCVVDGDGNACSFINSLYMGGSFGSSHVAKGYGVSLHNRGANFSLDSEHPNALAGGKRPYNTIIPAMALKDGELWATFGVMGGFMQPQGHFQVISAMLDDDVNPQEALDRPRWNLLSGTAESTLAMEEGYPVSTMSRLADLGHNIRPVSGPGRNLFGSGQIIRRDADSGVLFGGSDPRKDGHVAGY